jgi:hypothetical protein
LQDECKNLLKELQNEDFKNELNDISYNFIITNFGIYEGRGWNVQPEEVSDESTMTVLATTGAWKKNEINIKEWFESLVADGKILNLLAQDLELVCEADEVICRDLGIAIL